MKKLIPIVLCVLLLAGCGAQPTFETVNDLLPSGTPEPAKELVVSLPQEAATPAMEGENGVCLYECEDYVLTTQVLPGGDLDATLQQLTGFTTGDLAHMKTKQQGMDRYDCVWTAASETGEQVCRAVVLDDGSYHYAVAVMAEAAVSGDLTGQWQSVLRSVQVKTD